MNESTLVNKYSKRTQIFHSLMAVKIHSNGQKTQQQTLWELKMLEIQGNLRIYYPEVK